MDLTNEFRVGISVPEAWKVLTDLERIAPLLPGAQLQEIDGDEYRGVVKVKVGPITAQYKGQATFEERDEAAGRVVLRASGRDTRGQGNASAVITATMSPDGDATKVTVVTELTVTGKVAQFGRGVLGEVSAKLIGQFVDALEADLAESGAAPSGDVADGEEAGAFSNGSGPDAPESGISAGGSPAAAFSGPRRIDSPEVEPVDLVSVAGGATLKRLAPIVGLGLVLVLVVLARRRARRSHRHAARRAGLASNLHSVADLAGKLPSVSDLGARLPSVADLGVHLPSVAGVGARLPSVADLGAHLPSVAGVGAHLPSVADLGAHLSSIGEIADHLSDARIPDLRSAVRRARGPHR